MISARLVHNTHTRSPSLHIIGNGFVSHSRLPQTLCGTAPLFLFLLALRTRKEHDVIPLHELRHVSADVEGVSLLNSWRGGGLNRHGKLEEESRTNLYYFYNIASIHLPHSKASSRHILLSHSETSGKPIVIRPREGEKRTKVTAKAGVREVYCIDLRKVRSHALKVVIERGAELSLFVLSGSRTKNRITQSCTVASAARVRWWNLTLGGNVEQHLDIQVNGVSSRVDVRWVSHAKRRDVQDLTAQVTYAALKGGGETTMRGVVEDHAVLRSRGSIHVGRKARGTETFLSDQVLILDPAAKATAVPELNVGTNDVKAGHSAAVSRIHPEDLFYLQSRGLSPAEARTLSIEGFLGELMNDVPQEVRGFVAGGSLHC